MPGPPSLDCDVLIIGAGICGLTAARALAEGGQSVLVVEKGAGPGGRMASASFLGGTFDTGAQFFTARHPEFQSQVLAAAEAGHVNQWFRGTVRENGPQPDLPDSHPRFCAKPGMDGFPVWMARKLEVRFNCEIGGLRRQDDLWTARMSNGAHVTAGKLLLTCPVPQSLALLQVSGIELPAPTMDVLNRVTYAPCIAVLVQLDGPSLIPPPGACQPNLPMVHWIADNSLKGISPLAGSVTIHTSGAWTQENFDRDSREVAQEVTTAAAPWLGATVIGTDVRRWRYAKATAPINSPCLPIPHLTLCFAGDAFQAPRVEGAAVSGLAAARELLNMRSP